jgi:hypothetical protein
VEFVFLDGDSSRESELKEELSALSLDEDPAWSAERWRACSSAMRLSIAPLMRYDLISTPGPEGQ